MDIATLPGIKAQIITTSRLTTRVLFAGPPDGIPVLFLHGNLSSATWWEETMLSLPYGYRAIAPDQRGFGAADPTRHIDATCGMADLADDAVALLDRLNIERAHVVGNSMGGNVVWRLLMDVPERFLSVTQVAPGSPYGFGGTCDADGTPCFADYAGSGAGLFGKKLFERIGQQDRGTDSPFSPRRTMRKSVYRPPFIPEQEDAMVEAMLSVHLGPYDLPGDLVQSLNYPFYAPGKWGAANALSPKYVGDIRRLYQHAAKPPILWVRGRNDTAIADQGASDPAVLGKMGFLNGYPGEDVYPPQPMLAQTRKVLKTYVAAGGHYEEIVIEGAGHVPFIEKPAVFNAVFHAFLAEHGG